MKTRVLFLFPMALLLAPVGPAWFMPPGAAHAETTARPRVAVALAGGGAWGFAHVGVLEVIEELGIPVDIVVGTSIGSIAGALYAAGYTSEQLVAITETTNWNDVLFDSADRLQLGYEDRRQRRTFRASVGFRDGEVLLPSGASSGQRVVEYLDDLLRAHALTDSFLEMPRALAIVAADLVTGEEMVFTEGDLKTAIRASMSVPGAFSPVYYDGRYLIDGGWVNNLPVDVARNLGAEIVIAVNLLALDRQPEDLQAIGPILDQSAGILRRASITRNVELADVVITPDLRGTLPTDFQRAETLMQRGRDAAEKSREELEALARAIREERSSFQDLEDARIPPARPERDLAVTITATRFEIPPIARERAELYNPGAIEMLETLVQAMPDEETSIREIQHRVYSLYDTGLFEYVSYDLVRQTELVVYAVPTEIPRSTLSLGFGLRAQLVENSIALGIAHLRYTHDQGGAGPRLVADGWVSRTAGARLALELPLIPRVFAVPAVYAVSENMPFFDGRAVESFYVRRRFGGEAGLAAYLGRSWDIAAAGFGEWLALQRLEGTRVFDFPGTARYGARLEMWRDTLDRDLFPRHGSETRIAYRAHWDSEQEHVAHLGSLSTRRHWTPIRRLTLGMLARMGSDFLSGVGRYERFFLGGVENWYGYYYQELQARHYAVAGADARLAVGRLPLGIGDEIFLTGGVQYGALYDGELQALPGDLDQRLGAHAGFAFNTAAGALHLGTAINSEGRVMSFIELGPVYTVGGTGYDW
jgi:NTE family protein